MQQLLLAQTETIKTQNQTIQNQNLQIQGMQTQLMTVIQMSSRQSDGSPLEPANFENWQEPEVLSDFEDDEDELEPITFPEFTSAQVEQPDIIGDENGIDEHDDGNSTAEGASV
jgi:hypothetical protein